MIFSDDGFAQGKSSECVGWRDICPGKSGNVSIR